MKQFLILLAWLASSVQLSLAGDEKIKGNGNVVKKERALGDIHSISTGGSIDLRIIQDGAGKVFVETDENLQDVIITDVEDGALSIQLKKGVDISATKLVVYIHCGELKAISSGGSGDIFSDNTLRCDQLNISHGGSGDYQLELDVKKLKISTAGSGDYRLKGKTGSLAISMAGSGDVNAKELECEQATVSSAGSGDVFLKKGTEAKVSSVGSGDVSFY